MTIATERRPTPIPARAGKAVRITALVTAACCIGFAAVNVYLEATGFLADGPDADYAAGFTVLNWLVVVLKLVGATAALWSVFGSPRGAVQQVLGLTLWGAFATLAIYTLGSTGQAIGMLLGHFGGPEQLDLDAIAYVLFFAVIATGFGILAISHHRRCRLRLDPGARHRGRAAGAGPGARRRPSLADRTRHHAPGLRRTTMIISHGDAELFTETTGQGSPDVLLVHSGVGDRREWRAVVDRLAGTSRCIAYDARGHGSTRFRRQDSWSPHGDAAAVLDGHRVTSAVVIGASQGGATAIDLALTHPERVQALVLIAPAISGAPEPAVEARVRELDRQMDDADAAGDIPTVNRLEAWMWLDGPHQHEGRVGGEARTVPGHERRGAFGRRPGGARDPPGVGTAR